MKRSVLFLIAAVTLALPLPAATTGGSEKPMDPRQAAGGSLPELAAQAPFMLASDRITDLVSSRQLAGFASTVFDRESPRLILLWKGEVPAVVQTMVHDLISEGTQVSVQAAPYSLAEMDAEERRICALDRSVTGVHITGVAPLWDFSGIEVFVDPMDINKAAAAVTSSFKLQFSPRHASTPI